MVLFYSMYERLAAETSSGVIIPEETPLPLRGESLEAFAVRTPLREHNIEPGIRFATKPLELEDGNFTNSYELIVAPDAVAHFEIRSFEKPRFAHKLFADPNICAVVNGGFFYLSDDRDYAPLDATYNLCIRNREGGCIITRYGPRCYYTNIRRY